jgi:hypothetical protein
VVQFQGSCGFWAYLSGLPQSVSYMEADFVKYVICPIIEGNEFEMQVFSDFYVNLVFQ